MSAAGSAASTGSGIGGLEVFELVVAGLFAFAGLVSFLRWARRPLASASVREHVLYAIYLTGRVGLWFAFAGVFAGYALLEEPQRLRWYIYVPVGLAAMQLVAGQLLARSRAD